MKQRGFEFVEKQFMKGTENGAIPTRNDKGSAGYDFYTPITVTIKPHESQLIWTNIKSYMLEDEVLELHVRSSIGIKKGLMLKNVTGIIDSTYYSNPDNDGNIGICLYNNSEKEVTLEKGDRIAQGVFHKYLIVDNDEPLNERRVGGIGSSGK